MLFRKLIVSATAAILASCAPVPTVISTVQFDASDFVDSLVGSGIGPNKVQVKLTLKNPTDEPICIYAGVLHLSEIASARNPDWDLLGLEDDPYEEDPKLLIEGSLGDGLVEHELSGSIGTDLFSPKIRLEVGDVYSFSQVRDYGTFALFYGPARDGVGFEFYPADIGRFKVKVRGLRIYRCDALGRNGWRSTSEKWRKKVAQPISQRNPHGHYWEFEKMISGDAFDLEINPPPENYEITVYEYGLF